MKQRRKELPKPVITLDQALAVVASVMRFGNPNGVFTGEDYFGDHSDATRQDYIANQFDDLVINYPEAFNVELDDTELQDIIKGDN